MKENPLQYNQRVTLTVDRLGIHGEGVARLNGFTLFVEGALPGEEVSGIVTTKKKNYGCVTAEKINSLSPDRTEPICPLFSTCGGCQVMHLKYNSQLQAKRERVVDALERIGHFKEIVVEPCLPSPKELSYRNKMQLPIRVGEGGIKVGLYAHSSHDLVEVDHCYIHCDLGQRVYDHLLPLLKNSGVPAYNLKTMKGVLRFLVIKTAVHTKQVLVVFVTNGIDERLKDVAKQLMGECPEVKGVVLSINTQPNNVAFGEEYRLLRGQERIQEHLCGLKFNISASSFFQVNPSQAEELYNFTLKMAELSESDTVLDAYCGVGTLALIASQKVKRVIGIECVSEAIEDAKENGILNGIENAKFFCGVAERVLPTVEHFDVAILNPPRKGCDLAVIQELCKRKPSRIVYVSCDPATLARDLAIFRENGYRIGTVQPFDMFPQTAHVETVVQLIK